MIANVNELTLANLDPVVYVVDDDPAMRESIGLLLKSITLDVEAYDSARTFLNNYRPGRPSCLVLDVRMPGISGLDLQDMLAARNDRLPILIMTGHGDVPTVIRAFKAGAIDFIEKPFSDQILLDRIHHAIEIHRRRLMEDACKSIIDERIKSLSPREKVVMDMVAVGKTNRFIAADLGLSPKTIEVHRARVMEKMHARSLPDLIRMHLTVNTEAGSTYIN